MTALVLAVSLSVGGAPSIVAWCLARCSPTAAQAHAVTAPAGHCGLHDSPTSGVVAVSAHGMDGCAASHNGSYGLVDAAGPARVTSRVAPALLPAVGASVWAPATSQLADGPARYHVHDDARTAVPLPLRI